MRPIKQAYWITYPWNGTMLRDKLVGLQRIALLISELYREIFFLAAIPQRFGKFIFNFLSILL